MSGIAGIIHFDGRPVEPGQIESMTAFMSFRGPDGINHWRRGNVALGQCMLRTTPESLEEVQPLTNEDQSLVLVMDGRVDNWEQLRRELLNSGARLRTRADAELVLRAYEVWGKDSPVHIDGDFAYVIWDARERKAFCVRDRFCNKSLHHHWNGTTLAFSTDLRPTLELPWVPKELDPDTLTEYLATDWHTIDTTLWRAVKRIEPAHTVTFSADNEPRATRYWFPDLFAPQACKTDEEFVEHYRAVFRDVVRRGARSHRPVAMEVSGGLDSSAIFGVAEDMRKRQCLPAPGLEGYTLDFSADPTADEVGFAMAVGTHVGRVVHRVAPSIMPLDWYQNMASRFNDFPDYPNGAMAYGIYEQASRDGSCVLISGTGGDEWTGGTMAYYAEAMAEHDWHQVFRYLAEDVREIGWLRASHRAVRGGAMRLLPPRIKQGARRLARLGRNPVSERPPKWLSPSLQGLWAGIRRRNQSQAVHCARIGQGAQLHNLYPPYWMAAKGYNERRAALLGLELRQPFWSREFVELAFATPDRLMLRNGPNKELHRRALKDYLPREVVERLDKVGFRTVFMQHWPALCALMPSLLREPGVRRLVNEADIFRLMKAALHLDPIHWNEGPPWIVFALFPLIRDAADSSDFGQDRPT